MRLAVRQRSVLLLGLLLGACSTTPRASSVAEGAVLATVNGVEITEGELRFLAKVGPPQLKARLRSGAGRKQVIDDLIDRELLYAESVARGLDHDPTLLAQLDMNKRILIATTVLQAELTAAAQRYYEVHADEFTVVPLQHLLMKFGAARTEPAALKAVTALKRQIETGVSSFAEIAQQHSEDVVTKKNGGSLGKVSRKEARLVRRGYEDLLDKAFTLEPGKVAGPFKTTDGYHLIMIGEAPSQQPFAQIKAEIELRVRDEVRTTFLKQLREKATIEYRAPDSE